MLATLSAIAFIALLWWGSTGAVLWMAGGDKRQLQGRLLAMTIVCALGVGGLIIASASQGFWVPYLAVTSAVAVWAWIEFAFLAGIVTGPRRAVCPPGVSEGQRFHLAFRTIMHHELALVGALGLIWIIDSAGGNWLGFATFALLWVMRLSAKLTIFSGAPKLSLDMMPHRLSHMTTYFRFDRIGPVFWVSVALNTVLLAGAFYCLVTVPLGGEARTGLVMLTTLVALAVVEHIFMVIPWRDSRLWDWAKTNEETRTGAATPAE